MGFEEDRVEFIPADLTVREEVALLGEEDVFEMANLAERHTGLPGTIFISTVMASHGPRVKYYAGRPGHGPTFSVSIGPDPKIVANSMPPHEMRSAAPSVVDWVRRNHEALSTLWFEGRFWDVDEVQSFIGRLEKV